MTEKILFVDDEPNVLAGYKRQLRKDFEFDTAESGAAGLQMIESNGPYAVVISDMRMPQMDGITFLSRVRVTAPNSVRMVLTGNADLQTCIDAVNEGSIFRFLTKPCPPENLARSLRAGIEQYRLVCAERELLQGTLRGCIRTLTDILSLLNPWAFGRGSRIRRYVRHISAQLDTPYFWEYEMAATLSQVGCVALPPEVLLKINTGRPLTNEQRSVVLNHPSIGCQLLAEIPRLEMVAHIVALQNNPNKGHITSAEVQNKEKAIELGGQILHVALELDSLLQRGTSFIDALSALYSGYGPDHPIIEALMSFEKDEQDKVLMQTTAAELSTCMVAAEDICGVEGQVLLLKGQKITEPVRIHLQTYAQAKALKEPFAVEVVAESD